MSVEAEQALRAANQRFEQRFAQVERGLRDQGLEPSLETREEMERHWTLAKAAERQG
jgi:nucleoside triphosphate diphosphatase